MGLSLLLVVKGGLSEWFPAAVDADADVLLPLFSSVLGGRAGKPPGPAIIGAGCRIGAEGIRVVACETGNVAVVVTTVGRTCWNVGVANPVLFAI